VIELLLYAGLQAEDEGARELTPEHVRIGRGEVRGTDAAERIRGLDLTRKLVLLAIARKARKQLSVTTGEAENAYAVVCEEFGEKKRGHTQFWKYVRELDALGLIDAKLSGEGLVGKTTIISVTEIPAKALVTQIEGSLRSRAAPTK